MTEDLEELLLGGYCYSHRSAGPFTIGEDFEAPRPAAGILPRIKIERKTEDELWSFIAKVPDISANENSGAEVFDDAMRRLEFANGVSEVLNWYVSDRRFQAKLPTFRKKLKDLRKAIERFQSAIPDEDTLLDHFLQRGGGCSPDRTGLHLEFPASREFSREFFEKRASDDDSCI
jgi:hypothetical protein